MKIFRDPIHDVIDLDTGDKAVNDLIIKLIDSKEFQRLHFLKQLGLTYLAYPSATHSRFEHSLGVAYLAKVFLERIISLEERILSCYESSEHRGKLVDFFEQIKRHKSLTIVAALLHDIGHGALSHVTEDIISIKHEVWVKEIIFGNTEIHELLVHFDKESPQIIYDILSASNNSFCSGKIISGQLDIDKMDYLLRDSEIYSQYLLETKESDCSGLSRFTGKKLDINIDNVLLRELMMKSIEEAALSQPEDNEKVHPKVGAVLCDFNGKILLTAFRGKASSGAHCEFSLLKEAEEKGIDCGETVLFVTLEPCTRRGKDKIPCAQRIVNAGIPKVYIGAIDPNEKFRSIGETFLRDNGIEVERYPHSLVEWIRTMNKDFESQFRVRGQL